MISPSPAPATQTAPPGSPSAFAGADVAPAGFKELWAGDLAAWVKIWGGENTWRNHWKLWLNYCGLRATLLLRISQALRAARIPFLPGYVTRWNLTLHGLDIPASVPIGPGLYIPHPVGTVVTARSVGANVSLISSITIGMRNEPIFPIIGDNVFIGAGARILGNVTVGSHTNIGANAVVVKDVPPGRTAVGVPARLLPLSAQEPAQEPAQETV